MALFTGLGAVDFEAPVLGALSPHSLSAGGKAHTSLPITTVFVFGYLVQRPICSCLQSHAMLGLLPQGALVLALVHNRLHPVAEAQVVLGKLHAVGL